MRVGCEPVPGTLSSPGCVSTELATRTLSSALPGTWGLRKHSRKMPWKCRMGLSSCSHPCLTHGLGVGVLLPWQALTPAAAPKG